MNEFLRGTRIGRIGKKKTFSLSDIPDLSGRIAIVTGASTGLGKETAIALVKNGAQVIVAARKEAKGEPPIQKVLSDIRSAANIADEAQIDFIELDLASLKSVKNFADTFKSKYEKLDILVNNAGVSLCPFLLSEDGLELHFAVNHLGHFYLTNLLLSHLKLGNSSRVVIVSSRHHHDSYEEGVRLSIDDVNKTKGYDPSKGYGHSKLCNLLFMKELDRRLNSSQERPVIYINAAHPGFVNASGITRHIAQSMGKVTYIIGRIFQSLVALSVADGALTQIFLATSDDIEAKSINCRYYGPIAEEYEMSQIAQDQELATKLWSFSEKLIDEKIAGF